ncbi:hypothetical protein Focb16_v011833 [Fusarium oxysporum f. sp. cubense]|uniref:Uncharacterized protein n=1 Tax=Fusarium oxysporum f. sp. cubense TaxID=61366 RepID=A0A559LD86_FUSOC|nr:hypothetical protein Focb16_v011833 [Fusarium oxysporum f. sp. cubense]
MPQRSDRATALSRRRQYRLPSCYTSKVLALCVAFTRLQPPILWFRLHSLTHAAAASNITSLDSVACDKSASGKNKLLFLITRNIKCYDEETYIPC